MTSQCFTLLSSPESFRLQLPIPGLFFSGLTFVRAILIAAAAVVLNCHDRQQCEMVSAALQFCYDSLLSIRAHFLLSCFTRGLLRRGLACFRYVCTSVRTSQTRNVNFFRNAFALAVSNYSIVAFLISWLRSLNTKECKHNGKISQTRCQEGGLES